MINQMHVDRLLELSKTKLNCSLDDNSPDYVPPDLIPGTYRWFLYFYSNMFTKEDEISKSDKLIFISIFKKLKDEHTISWTRDTLCPLDEFRIKELKNQLIKNIRDTKNFYELKVNLYLYRCIKNGWIYADLFIFEHSPSLRAFAMAKEKKYKFTKAYDLWNSCHIENLNLIKNEYHGKDNLNFLEIGTFEARTAVWLLDNALTGNNCRIYCVDPNIKKNGQFNLSLHGDRVNFIGDYSDNVLIDLLFSKRIKFDLIYVDGEHNAPTVIVDLVLSWKLLKVGGIMLIDDYEMEILDPWFFISHKEFSRENPRLRFTHPRYAIDPFLSIYRGQYDKIIDNYQIGIRKTIDFLPPDTPRVLVK